MTPRPYDIRQTKGLIESLFCNSAFLIISGTDSTLVMTRSNKANDRNHAGLADGSAIPEDRLPRYFAKSGHADADPTSIKKQGGGRGNWSVNLSCQYSTCSLLTDFTGDVMVSKLKT
jgi:hypothetical protein